MQKVLDYREQLEEEAKVDLAHKQKLLEEARALFERLKAELRQSEDHLFESALVPQQERWLLEQYVKGLKGDVAQAALQARMSSAGAASPSTICINASRATTKAACALAMLAPSERPFAPSSCTSASSTYFSSWW